MGAAAVRDLFDPAAATAYLDSATYGLPPQPTVEAMRQAIDDWQSGSADWVSAWDKHGDVCRQYFASLIETPGHAVALIPSVSVGVGVIAASLRSGDHVLVPDDEFTSVLFPLLVAQQAHGVIVETVPFE